MSNFVPGEGNPNSKIVFVGEAPGSQEDRLMRPFVGPAGDIMDSIFKDVGIHRSQVWLTNVYKHKLPGNNWLKAEQIGLSLDKSLEVLWTEIHTIDPNVIVALGSNVMNALTGKKKVTNYRGSILQSTHGYPKVVPTYHPAHLLYHQEEDESEEVKSEISGYWQKYVIAFDFKKALRQAQFKEFRLPDRTLSVARSSSDVYSFLERNKNREYCSFDIETMHSIPVCIALAFSRFEAMSIPLLDYLNGFKLGNIPPHDLAFCWEMVDATLNNPKFKKIAQNGKFDIERLERICGITVDSLYGDTMMLMHTLYPEFPRSLAFICSLYTDEPYYKDEGREFNVKKDKIDQLYLYNAKDAVVTLECWEEMLKEYQEDFL